MSDWLHNLPVTWMALVVFGFTYMVAAAIYLVVSVLAVGERARSFKAVSPGMLPPLGIIFGLFVAFTAGVPLAFPSGGTGLMGRLLEMGAGSRPSDEPGLDLLRQTSVIR